MEVLIQTFGYWAILVGTFLEGETILVLAGFAAQRGYLNLPWVCLMAFVGSVLGDQLFFLLGRSRAEATVKKHPSWKPSIDRARSLLDHHKILIVLTFRFLYGLRTVIPFVIGMSRFPIRQFVLLNIMGAAIWAVLFGCAGFLFGHALEHLLDNLKRYESWVMAAIAVAGAIFWIWHLRRKKTEDCWHSSCKYFSGNEPKHESGGAL